MRYIMRQKFWSWGDDFTIKDENEQDVFLVDGAAFSWGDNLSVQDMDGNQLAHISQALFTLMPRYEIFRNGEKFAEVIKEFSWFNSSFTLDVPGPNDYSITGSFWQHEYEFQRKGQTVARVSKRYFSWTDTYGIDVVDGEDVLAILSTCIVIDLICHDEKND